MASETVKKVWHIFHYDELFSARDIHHPERGPIPMVYYSQRPITGWDEYSGQYMQQMAALKLQSKTIEQYIMVKHVFEELLDCSQKYHRGNRHLRGYILNEKLMPADSDRIAAMLEFDKRTTKRYLSWLEKVGLIELVEMPKLKTAAELEAEKNEDDSAKNVDNSGKKAEMGNSGDAAPQNSPRFQESGKRVTGTDNNKNKYPGTGKGKENKNPNPKGKETDLQRQVEEMAAKGRKRPKPEAAGEIAEDTPTGQNAEYPNPTGYPTKTDGGATVSPRAAQGDGTALNPITPTKKPNGGPPGSRTAAQGSGINPNPTRYPTQPDGGPPEVSRDAHAGRTRLENTSLARDCLGFAEEVFRRLGLQPTEKNPQAAELASWSNAWARAVALHRGTPWLLELRNKTLKKADKLRNRRGPGNKSAILMHEFNKRILAGKAA